MKEIETKELDNNRSILVNFYYPGTKEKIFIEIPTGTYITIP